METLPLDTRPMLMYYLPSVATERAQQTRYWGRAEGRVVHTALEERKYFERQVI